jgi:hypothetical protein
VTSGAIRTLVEKGALQLSLVDEKNLAEITSPVCIAKISSGPKMG